MDQQHNYEEPLYGGAVTDRSLQPAWLCTPQIKVENDVGVYHCHALRCNDNNLNSSKSSDFDSLESTSQYSKNVPLTSHNNYCDNRGIPENAEYVHESNPLSNMQHSSAEVPHPDVCMDRTSTSSPYLPQSNENCEDPDPNGSLKINKCLSSSWCIQPLRNEDLHHDQHNEKHLYPDIHHESCETRDMKNHKTDAPESRQAFDLTCRNKNLSEEKDCFDSNSPVIMCEEAVGTQPQARCTPKPQTCKICGKVLSSPSSYYVHMKLHSGNKPYACSMCEASFCRKPYLEVHMRTHTGERPFECGTCNKRFTQKSSLNTHKRVHTGERPYSCDICQKTFAVKSYVTAHRWSHVSERPLGCQRCGLTFTSKNLFSLHIRTHIDQNHECHICGRTFMKDSYLIRHQNRVHRDQSAPYSDANESRLHALSPQSLSSSCRSIASQ